MTDNKLQAVFAAFSSLLLAIGSCLGTSTIAGCQTGPPRTAEQQAVADQSLNSKLGALKDAKFNGQFKFMWIGAPFSVWAKNQFGLGPETHFEANGDVDFRDSTPGLQPSSMDVMNRRLEAVENRLVAPQPPR